MSRQVLSTALLVGLSLLAPGPAEADQSGANTHNQSSGTPATALPSGWFHLQGTVKDPIAPFALRALDVQWQPDGRINGFVRVNGTIFPKDSQLWRRSFPASGRIGEIKLKNKVIAQCISKNTTLRTCSDPSTTWVSIPQGGNKVVIRSDFGSRNEWCLAKGTRGNLESLRNEDCTDHRYTPQMIWEARPER
ncbi:hypothetical protein GCM10010191_28700 [Actinomadura vinacea]|uniref:Ricin B lectin domain-containing protein n=2 Tax=Actinomadura vinacea TaxID=115336 RepID=A0ABN3IZF5_9ACTN